MILANCGAFDDAEVRRRGILVYLSGTGADEIISDYGHAGPDRQKWEVPKLQCESDGNQS